MAGQKNARRERRINRGLRRWFTSRGLPLEEVWSPSTDDPEQQNRELERLQRWVESWTEFRHRDSLVVRGFEEPPVTGSGDLEQRWSCFVRWTGLEPEDPTIRRAFEGRELPDHLSQEELVRQIDQMLDILEERKVAVSLHRGVPLELIHTFLSMALEEEFVPGFFNVLDGCDGYCPGCFQRPWCETGLEGHWPLEDEQADGFALPLEVKILLARIEDVPDQLEMI